MIKTVDELKDLILWAKEQKLAVIKIGDVEVHVSPYAFVEGIGQSQPVVSPDISEINLQSDDTVTDDDLFHSV